MALQKWAKIDGHELTIAHEVQEQLFPKEISQLESLEVHGFCRPARTVRQQPAPPGLEHVFFCNSGGEANFCKTACLGPNNAWSSQPHASHNDSYGKR